MPNSRRIRDCGHRSGRKTLAQLAQSGDLDVKRLANWGMSVTMVMRNKLRQIKDLIAYSGSPLPLVLDSLGLKFRPYHARVAEDLIFEMTPGTGDWFTLYECAIRRDYFQGSVLGALDGSTVIDIGANFGAFTVLASRIVGPRGRVVAFEPDPRTFARLERNVKTNGCSNVTCCNYAVSGADGEISFYRHEKSAYGSIVAAVDGRISSSSEIFTVPVRDIFSILNELDGEIGLMKIDCEGAEYAIFDRLENKDVKRVNHITLEYHEVPGRSHAELKSRLAVWGFLVSGGNPLHARRS